MNFLSCKRLESLFFKKKAIFNKIWKQKTDFLIPHTQLSPESIYPRKVDVNFLPANFEQFMVLEAKEQYI